MARLQPYFPRSHGKPRVDVRRVLSGIVLSNRNGLRWCDAPNEYGPPKTLYNRWKRWSEIGVFARIFEGLAAEAADQKTIMIDATYLKAHRTASSMRGKKGGALSADRAEWLLVDRGYDADWFCDALKDKGIRPCIPGRKSRGKPVKYDKRRYKSRNGIEIMFGRLKDWRRVATRDDRCPVVFLKAVALVATVIFWLRKSIRLELNAIVKEVKKWTAWVD